MTKTRSWTVSDEAFALTLFKNNLEVWKEEITKRSSILTYNEEDITQNQISKPKPLFTRSRRPPKHYSDTEDDDTTNQTSSTKSQHSWSQQGIKYYNDMIDHVQRDRLEHPNFDTDLIETFSEKRSRKRKNNPSTGFIVPKICMV